MKTRSRVLLILPNVDESVRGFHYVFNVRDVVLQTAKRSFRIAAVIDGSDKLGFEYLCRLALVRGNLTVAIDELHEFCPSVFGAIPHYFKKLCLRGRHAGVEIFGVSQRPANLHKDFFSQAQHIHVFRLIYPGDIDALKRIVPGVERAAQLKVGEKITFPS